MKDYDVRKFARSELEKNLEKIGVHARIELGLFEEFGIETKVDDPYYDDAIEISVKNRAGYIAGSNERSILIGVYRLLYEWGVRYVRPGKDGTSYPEKCRAKDVEISETASNRHRVICIEGAVTIENVTDMIEWLPKVGFNGYYIQFKEPYVFFERWFNHTKNEYREPEAFDESIIGEYYDIMVAELKKRGLIIHTMGHGWTTFPFGISANGWYEADPETFSKEYIDMCAVVNGKREIWENIPIQTQLCYTNPKVRKIIEDAVVNYVHEHPFADVVYFWLGDGINNTCECPECSKRVHSDNTAEMSNAITDRLVAEGLKTKIAGGCGYNGMQPPVVNAIRNQDNRMITFAPISRTYSEAFPGEFKVKEIPEYKINGFTCPKSVDENLAGLYNWQKVFKGDFVDFDYHLMWDHILDAGGEGISRVIHQDMQNLASLGMNGYVSCQLQRNAFPTSLAMTAMAKTLWNRETDFEEIRRELYEASFGKESVDILCDYFSALSDAFDIGAIRMQKVVDHNEFRAKMENAIKLMEEFDTVIDKYKDKGNECQKASWGYLAHHRNAYIPIGRMIVAKIDRDEDAAKKHHETAIEYVMTHEDEIQSVLDAMFFYRMTNERITVTRESIFNVF